MAGQGVLCLTLFTCGIVIHTALAVDNVSLGCFGSAGSCLNHNLTCSDTARVAIKKAVYGHKTWVNCTTGVISCSDTCCSYLRNSDCFHTFIADDISDIYRNCSSHFCDFRTPRLVEPCSGFQAVSSYSVVEYECVEESSTIPMCGAATYTVGTSVSVLYDPTQQYMVATDVCYCTVSQPNRNRVTIEGIDVRMTGPAGQCGVLGIYNSSSTFTQQTCNSLSPWPSLTLAQTSDYYFFLTLTNLAEFVWIRFKGTNALTVACSLNAVHTTTPAPTTTTTPTATSTTVTYPTASPPITTQPPTQSSSSSPATSATSATTNELATTPKSTITVVSTPTTSSASKTVSISVTPETWTTSTEAVGPGTTSGAQGAAGSNVGVVVGAVAGGIFILVVIVAIGLCRRKHKATQQSMKLGQLVSTDTEKGRQAVVYDNIVISHVPESPVDPIISSPVSETLKTSQSKSVGQRQTVEASQTKEAAELYSKLDKNTISNEHVYTTVVPSAEVKDTNTTSNEHVYTTVVPSAEVKDTNIVTIRL
ncbi:cell wall protein DAN4-like isoform X2 [Haliotis rubra]|uniref:cell wall protein DAN4-like isoform X2 n=1 Tax=Haliotis rubra TaxID=36100 RepID=UPI001EE5D255|nr:cell wall protein DAN4-like isoform X2 [Haliotis rubra]